MQARRRNVVAGVALLLGCACNHSSVAKHVPSAARPAKPVAVLVSSSQVTAPDLQLRFVLYADGVVIYGQQTSPGAPARYARAVLPPDELQEIVRRLGLDQLPELGAWYQSAVTCSGSNVIVFLKGNDYRRVELDGAFEDLPEDPDVRAARNSIPRTVVSTFEYMRRYRNVRAQPHDPEQTVVGLWHVTSPFPNSVSEWPERWPKPTPATRTRPYLEGADLMVELPGSSFLEAQDWEEALRARMELVTLDGTAYVPRSHAAFPSEEVWLAVRRSAASAGSQRREPSLLNAGTGRVVGCAARLERLERGSGCLAIYGVTERVDGGLVQGYETRDVDCGAAVVNECGETLVCQC